MCDDERWADLPGYEGLYKISDRGGVFNVVRQKPLSGTVTAGGYHQVQLSKPGERARCLLVHALVLMAFVGPRPYGLVCNHKSGQKLQNELDQLEWCTQRQNMAPAARTGLLRPNPPRGETTTEPG